MNLLAHMIQVCSTWHHDYTQSCLLHNILWAKETTPNLYSWYQMWGDIGQFLQSFTKREVHIKSDKSLTTHEQATVTASMHSETATRFPCHCILAKHNKIWTHLLVSSTEAQQICSVYGTSTHWHKVTYINEMQTGLELAHTMLAAFIDVM